ncbi:uncharacterized protein LOC144914981 [Branchiostoma floridae x Branchiostoma belcheri]
MLFHLHYHLVEGVRRFGTAQSFWMFPAERRHHLFKQLIKSPKYPEASIMNRFKYVLAAQRLRHNGEVPVDLVDIFQQYDKVDDFERGYSTRRRRNEDENDYEDIVVHGAGCHLSFSSFAQRLGANSAGSFGMFFGTPREMVLNEADRQLLVDHYSVDNLECQPRESVTVYHQAQVPEVDRQYLIQFRSQWWKEEAPLRSRLVKRLSSYLVGRFRDDNPPARATNGIEEDGQQWYYWIGRIQEFWLHNGPRHRPEQLVKVLWYSMPNQDRETGFWFVDTTRPSSGTTVEDLLNMKSCLPLVAVEGHHIWILSINR